MFSYTEISPTCSTRSRVRIDHFGTNPSAHLDENLVHEAGWGGEGRFILVPGLLVKEIAKDVDHDLGHAVLLGHGAVVLYRQDHRIPA